MIFASLLISVLTFVGFLIYRWGTKNADHFKGRGIKHMSPKFLFGNTQELMSQKMTVYDFIRKIYDDHPGERAVGMFSMRQPVLLVRDPVLIKELVVKEFDKFTDHSAVLDSEMDSMMGNALLALNGQKWKDMRATLSPIFTGSKMRQMFQQVMDLCQDLVDNIEETEVNVKDLTGRVTNDIISLCAFGLKSNSIKDKDSEFYSLGQQLMNFKNSGRVMKIMGFKLFPKLMRLLKVQVVEEHLKAFFRAIVMDTIKHRVENKIHRPDMINLIMEVKENTENQWTDNDLIAQCFIFFLAGYDTSSTAMSFAIYELATDPAVQRKLYEEIKAVKEQLDGAPLTYEILLSMKYMDAVVNEVLRKCAPVAFTDRLCTADFQYNDSHGFCYKFSKGDTIWIPIHGFHMNPEYFPNPDSFDPERFLVENKQRINADAYMPFGIGQRSCIANRFALMELKALLFFLLDRYSLNITAKTQIPLKIIPGFGPVETEKGIWVGIEKRQ